MSFSHLIFHVVIVAIVFLDFLFFLSFSFRSQFFNSVVLRVIDFFSFFKVFNNLVSNIILFLSCFHGICFRIRLSRLFIVPFLLSSISIILSFFLLLHDFLHVIIIVIFLALPVFFISFSIWKGVLFKVNMPRNLHSNVILIFRKLLIFIIKIVLIK